MKPNRSPRPQSEVMAEVASKFPDLARYCYMDRSWIWYCGPSLEGAANKKKREALSLAGFRFAPKGHVMQDGKTLGSWSHSCDQPRKRIFRGRRPNQPNQQLDHDEQPDPLDALAALGV